jgi:diaminohydroxyphosphoribosylaminopyrimidine deaminase / 5-amino-6-(5-phosphoribosylamino)uracil reductase
VAYGRPGAGSKGFADPQRMKDVLQAPDRVDLGALLAQLGQRAVRHRFDVAPNPCVGAALLDGEGRILAEGFHERWGGPHAEVQCLENARAAGVPQERWHTMAVTLEPCSSQGKTPPCTEALIRAGLRRVVVGSLDPDTRHRGAGLGALRAAGIEVELRDGASPLERVAPHFLRWNEYERLRRPRPWLIAKWAQTLSGHLSPPEHVGEGRWISSPDSLRDLQFLRASVEAIVTGVGTVKADDPRLTLRYPAPLDHPPMRVVLDSALSTTPEARLLQPPERGAAGGPVVLLCVAGAQAQRHRALQAAGARIHGLHPGPDGRVSLREALEWLWRFGARRVLLEAGPRLLSAFFQAGFVDQLRIYTGDVRGGRGESLAGLLAELNLESRADGECGPDQVLQAFVGRGPRR